MSTILRSHLVLCDTPARSWFSSRFGSYFTDNASRQMLRQPYTPFLVSRKGWPRRIRITRVLAAGPPRGLVKFSPRQSTNSLARQSTSFPPLKRRQSISMSHVWSQVTMRSNLIDVHWCEERA